MQHVQETNLAWALIEAAKPALDARERNHAFICVGAGDAFTAIRILLKLISDKQISIPSWLIQSCVEWLEAYVLHEDHERLRLILDCLAVNCANLRPRAIVRTLGCTRSPAALAVAAEACHDRSAVRAG